MPSWSKHKQNHWQLFIGSPSLTEVFTVRELITNWQRSEESGPPSSQGTDNFMGEYNYILDNTGSWKSTHITYIHLHILLCWHGNLDHQGSRIFIWILIATHFYHVYPESTLKFVLLHLVFQVINTLNFDVCFNFMFKEGIITHETCWQNSMNKDRHAKTRTETNQRH